MRAARALVPLAAVVAALWTYSWQIADAHRDAATRRRVDATLLAPASRTLDPKSAITSSAGARVRVEYGRGHTVMATVPRDLKAGTHLKVWIDDRTGEPAAPPITAADAVIRAFVVAGMTFMGLLIARHGARVGLHLLIARREASRIDEEWEAISPTWTRRDKQQDT